MASQADAVGATVGAFKLHVVAAARPAGAYLNVAVFVRQSEHEHQFFTRVLIEPACQVAIADLPATIFLAMQDAGHDVEFHLVGGRGQLIDRGASHLFHGCPRLHRVNRRGLLTFDAAKAEAYYIR